MRINPELLAALDNADEQEYRLEDIEPYDDKHILTLEQFSFLKVEKNKYYHVVCISTGRKFENVKFEVYTEDEWNNEFEMWFADGIGANRYKSISEYLLLRLRDLRMRGKASVSYILYVGDNDGWLEQQYEAELTGTYKNGTFNGSFHDTYLEYMDDDTIDGWK